MRKILSFTEYLKVNAINQSALKKIFQQSPLHYWDENVNPDRPDPDPSASMRMGTALHGLVLEGAKRWNVVPKTINRRTNKGKQEYQEFLDSIAEDFVVLKQEEEDTVYGMAESLDRNPEVNRILSSVNFDQYMTEQMFVWEKPYGENTVSCKARLDVIKRVGNEVTVVDLKTTRDASKNGFVKSIYNYGYHMQGYFYLEAALNVLNLTDWIGSQDVKLKFRIIAVENVRPYASQVITIDPRAIDQGKREINAALSIYMHQKARFTDDSYPWDSYQNFDSTEDVIVGLPGYAQDLLYNEFYNIDQ